MFVVISYTYMVYLIVLGVMMKISFIEKESLIYIGLALVLYYFQFTNWNGEYLDSDCFFHALRMIDWFENPSFFERKMWWSNYPFGEISHWTKPIYLIWGILSLFFLPFYTIKTAVFYAGILICPLFCFLTIIFLVKALKNVLSLKYRLLVFVLLVIQASFMRSIIFYRPDHHAIFVFLSAFIIYLVGRFIGDKSDKILKIIAFTLAFSLWLAVEGVFLFVGVFLFLLVSYLFLGYDYKNLIKLCFWYAFGVCVCIIINPSYQGMFFIDTGRISIFYAVALFSIWLILFGARNVKNKIYQTFMLFALFLILVLCFYLLGWLSSPVDEKLNEVFLARITEMRGMDLYTGAYPFFGILLGLLLLRKNLKDERLIYLLISLSLYGFLALFGIRFVPYCALYSAIIIALYIQNRAQFNKKTTIFVIFFVLLEYISFIVNLIVTGRVMDKPSPSIYFSELDKFSKGSVVSDTFFAPHIVWYGNRPVVASPYHGNVEGILDNHEILFSSDENRVKELIRKHEVGSIYLIDTQDGFYANPLENCDKLYGKILGCKNYPQWLVLVPNTNGSLFKIDYSKL